MTFSSTSCCLDLGVFGHINNVQLVENTSTLFFHTRKITLNLFKKKPLKELAVLPKAFRILLKSYLLETKKLNLENLTPKVLIFY